MKYVIYLVGCLWILIACNQKGKRVVHIHEYKENAYFTQQLRYLTDLIEDDDENAHAHFLKAKLYQDNNAYEKALIEINQAIELEPNFPDYYFLKGDVLYKQKKWKKALEAVSRAETLGMKQIQVYELLAKIHTELQHTTDAEQYINRISQLDPYNYNLNFLRAINSYYVSDTLYAIRRFELAIKDGLNIEECLQYLAKIHIARKQYDQAILKINEAMKMVKNPMELNLLKAQIIENQGYIDSALVIYQTAWKYDTLNYDLNKRLAKMVYQKELFDSTLFYISKMGSDSTFSTQLLRADAYFGLRDYPNSTEYYEKALLFQKETQYIRNQLARIEWRIAYQKRQEFIRDSIQKVYQRNLKLKRDSLQNIQ